IARSGPGGMAPPGRPVASRRGRLRSETPGGAAATVTPELKLPMLPAATRDAAVGADGARAAALATTVVPVAGASVVVGAAPLTVTLVFWICWNQATFSLTMRCRRTKGPAVFGGVTLTVIVTDWPGATLLGRRKRWSVAQPSCGKSLAV